MWTFKAMESPSFHAFLLFIFLFSSAALPNAFSTIRWNDDLQKVEKVGVGFLVGQEDVAVDKEGTLYTSSMDGWIKRKRRNEEWKNWKLLPANSAVAGITPSGNSDLLVCDVNEGLLKINEEGVQLFVSEVNGSKIRFANDVVEASDGCIYFTVSSTKYDSSEWYKDIIEGIPHGRLLKYDPHNNETSILLESLAFANGVALSQDEHFLVVCESWGFRCLKYWVKGEMEGKTEVFIDNLPGGPDNVNLAPDGSFWIALVEVRNGTRQQMTEGLLKSARVIKVGENGKISCKLDDSTGKVITFVTSALEFEGHLYLASPGANFLSNLKLNQTHEELSETTIMHLISNKTHLSTF